MKNQQNKHKHIKQMLKEHAKLYYKVCWKAKWLYKRILFIYFSEGYFPIVEEYGTT